MTAPDTQTGGIAAERLKSFIERIERLEAEKAELAGDIREIYAEAKGTGFDTKIMRECIRLRKMESAARSERDQLIELYRRALGDLDGTPLGEASLTRSSRSGGGKTGSAVERMRKSIAAGEVSIEGGGVKLEADGKGGVKSTPTHPRAGSGKLMEAVHDHLVGAGAAHQGGNKYRIPDAKDAAPADAEPAAPAVQAPTIEPPAPAAENDDLAMPPMFAGAAERQAAALQAGRTGG